MKRHLPALVAFAAVAVLVTWPTAATLGAAVPGQPTSDVYDHLWGAWWYAYELGRGHLPLRTDVSHWPPGGLLWFIDPLGGLLSLPLQLRLAHLLQLHLLLLLMMLMTMDRQDRRWRQQR